MMNERQNKLLICGADTARRGEMAELLERIDRIAGEEGKNPQILLELNVSGEASKGGMTSAELPAAAERAASCQNLRFSGLMTMAPLGAERSELEKIFSTLKNLRDTEAVRLNIALPVLSMGMSGDYRIAIEEGAVYKLEYTAGNYGG